MALRVHPMAQKAGARSFSVFLSASIPDPSRWEGEFSPLEITDAVTALARTALTQGASLVTAAHPTIAPLLLYVAAEFPRGDSVEERIVVYQSRLFADILPRATRRFEDAGIGTIRWTDAVQGEQPEPGKWDGSLLSMRRTMLTEAKPAGAVFIGGMEGVGAEFDLFGHLYPERPRYAIGRPGGYAQRLATSTPTAVQQLLRGEMAYPTVWRRVLEDIESRIDTR